MNSTTSEISIWQKVRVVRMNRSEILEAPYNPRFIDEDAKRKLRKNLEQLGLLCPLIVNDRTKHLVSGHQRIAIVDTLEHRKDYEIDIGIVDLTEQEEKEQVVALNNPYLRGTFDFARLAIILPELGPEPCGFDAKDLSLIIPALEAPLNAPTTEQMEDVKRTGAEIEQARIASRQAKAAANPADELDRKERIKAMRAVLKKTKTSRFEREGADSQDVEYFIVAQFNTLEARRQFLTDLSLPPEAICASGESVAALVVKALAEVNEAA